MTSTDAVVDPQPPSTASLSAREAAIALARSGAPLNAHDLMAILQISAPTFYYHRKRGRYDKLKVKAPMGPREFSGVLVSKWLDGEVVFEPSFGRKRVRSWPSR